MSNMQIAPLPDHSAATAARNSLLNLLGQGAPLIAAIFAIPVLVGALGVDRFGMLALAWVLIGYFSLFDFGIGRALTKGVADRLGCGQAGEIPALVWTALSIMLLLGCVGGVFVWAFAPWLVYQVFVMPGELHGETLSALYLLAWSLPVVITTAGLRGVLEAYQRFGLVNAIRVPMGLFTFLGPLLVLPFSNNLDVVVAMLVLGRLVGWCAHLVGCLHVIPALRRHAVVERALIMPLVRFGGWLTVTNIVGPLMVYLDRFLIGALLSMAAVAFYTTPYEVVTKLLLIPAAISGALFPVFAASFVAKTSRAKDLFVGGVKVTFLALFPLTLMIVAFSHEGLDIWLGHEFADKSNRVMQYLAVGVFLNCLAQLPFTLIQALGRPDISAKLHLVELPFYLLLLWLLSVKMGIEGAAIAWMLRAAIDMMALFFFAEKLLPDMTRKFYAMLLTLLAALTVLGVAAALPGMALRGGGVVLLLVVFVMLSWTLILKAEERRIVEYHLGRLWGRIKGKK